MKRRQVQRQTKINQTFANCKSAHNQSQMTSLNSQYDEKERGLNLFYQNGAKNPSTPYRSLNRVKTLLTHTPHSIEYGSSKLITAPTALLDKVYAKSNDYSKPSSVTTAYTQATTTCGDYSSYRDEDINVRKRDQKQKASVYSSDKKVGSKRKGQLKLDQMEYFTRMNARNQEALVNMLKLTDKKTGAVYNYNIYDQSVLKAMDKHPIVNDFDMTKLEVEYDYDTDAEQQRHSKKMMQVELMRAIQFYVIEDPIKLVDNVLI